MEGQAHALGGEGQEEIDAGGGAGGRDEDKEGGRRNGGHEHQIRTRLGASLSLPPSLPPSLLSFSGSYQ